jgi:hypothetical protein
MIIEDSNRFLFDRWFPVIESPPFGGCAPVNTWTEESCVADSGGKIAVVLGGFCAKSYRKKCAARSGLSGSNLGDFVGIDSHSGNRYTF